MGIDTKTGPVFLTSQGRRIRHLQKHQHINLDFRYLDTATGQEFDVRDLPAVYLADDAARASSDDPVAHRRIIARAITDGFGAGFDRHVVSLPAA